MTPTPPASENPWRDRLYGRFRERGTPVLVAGGTAIPAASLWVGTRLWVTAFRAAGLGPGGRVVLAAPPSPGFVQVLLAGLWAELTLVIADPRDDADRIAEETDAALVVGHGPGQAAPAPVGTPPDGLPTPRPMRHPLAPTARLLIRTSGTSGRVKWVGLSDRGILAVLDSHLPRLDLSDRRLLCAIPWHHSFGLVLDLLAGLMAGAIVVRDESGGRDPDGLLRVARRWECDWLSAVPLLVRRVCGVPGGEEFVRGLAGGIVGGAAVDPDTAAVLGGTRLRAGYGQTEASPGVALGEPGEWSAGYLGRPLGCRVEIRPDGGLWYAGPNVCAGVWGADGFEPSDPGRWVNSGDAVAQEPDGGLVFRGRTDDRLKLENGRFVHAAEVERTIRQACPGMRELLVTTATGRDLSVWWDGDRPPDLAAAAARLGALGPRLRVGPEVRPEDWVRSPKGEVLRRATVERLKGMTA
jgi:acyl-CoA synthetase (AMP-forming)/AMP-acid ligase II